MTKVPYYILWCTAYILDREYVETCEYDEIGIRADAAEDVQSFILVSNAEISDEEEEDFVAGIEIEKDPLQTYYFTRDYYDPEDNLECLLHSEDIKKIQEEIRKFEEEKESKE